MLRRGLLSLVVVLSVVSLVPAATAQAPAPTVIRVLSTRADLVAGGDALVEVILPDGTDPAAVRVDVDGRDVTDRFAVRPDGRYLGLVTGLALGDNLLVARLADGSGAHLTITNHPRGGPVFSGPQIGPWTCAEGALDSQCNRPPTYEYHYLPSGGGSLQPYDPDNPPRDVAETTTDEGVTVPFIVRLEIGVLLRDEYRIAVLFDPSQPWEPWAPQESWNRKLLVTHGAGCDVTFAQGTSPSVFDDTVTGGSPTVALGRGFAVISHALDNAGHNCNSVTQAESVLVTKEYFVDRYGGPIRYTIGTGCSGGSLAQQLIANAYPGTYQGILPACSYPDAWSTLMQYHDYVLLRRYFENPSLWSPGVVWTPPHIAAANGHPNYTNPVSFTAAIAPQPDPSRSCPGLDAELVYHHETNPEGVRCSLQDYMVNVFGRRSEEVWTENEHLRVEGHANLPLDNVGIQYALAGLLDGTISPQQFVDLNAKIGSRDIDYEQQEARQAADPGAIERAYRSGTVNVGNNLDQVAIIDLRGADPGAFHDVYRTYAMRERLIREHGHADNQLLWRGTVPLMGDRNFATEAFLAMDEWLAAVEADERDIPFAQKIVEDRPEHVTHRCTDGDGNDAPEEACDAIVERYSTPRIEAGMPLTDDVMKCQLVPLDEFDYGDVEFTDEQWAALGQVFPTGVCDYSRPSVEFTDTVPWLDYSDTPGGEPLGAAPVSVPFASGTRLPVVRRHAGAERTATAVAVSGLGRDSADTVVVARRDVFADALAGGPLSVALDAPLLLTDPAALSESTSSEIGRLGATRAVLLGGTAAINDELAGALEDRGLEVERVSGPNRYATAVAIAQRVGSASGELFLASGEVFADALSAGGIAGASGAPLLLTSQSGLSPETAAALGPSTRVTVVGGEAAISAAVLNDVDARAGDVRRVAGADRYATSVAMARDALARGISPRVTWVATGNDFPDGLVAGAAAGRDRALLVLVDRDRLDASPASRDLLTELSGQVDAFHIAGGPAAVSLAVEAALQGLFEA